MAADVVIRAEGLGKRYVIARTGDRERYVALRDVIAGAARSLGRTAMDLARGRPVARREASEAFWALSNVSFEVRRGEVLGVIGRNGAGKSTLLKILSRITEPTRGRVTIKGRVASLMEVGTGFHPELTGRENIYLNGAILGMRYAEIRRKFDEIVAFAEVEKFLDTPVKRYSSGMYVRLAFAVAGHLEPEILIVDEVLAVGDAEFQRKCLGKMSEVAGHGRTVIFVSHNLAAVQQLCQTGLLLDQGALAAQGAAASVTAAYISSLKKAQSPSLMHWSDRNTSGEGLITRFELEGGSAVGQISFGAPLRFRISASFRAPIVDPSFGLIVQSAAGERLANVHSIQTGLRLGSVDGEIAIEGMIDHFILYPGEYLLSPWIMDSAHTREIDFVQMCAGLTVVPAPGPCGDLRLDPDWGKVHLKSRWRRIAGKG
ncbi:MAG: ABC transporter ATP-binding protein [Caulobacteraceae bacterium]|nr:ABC transporter ATP-binding protein [Caulobacteraceae bacterium]